MPLLRSSAEWQRAVYNAALTIGIRIALTQKILLAMLPADAAPQLHFVCGAVRTDVL